MLLNEIFDSGVDYRWTKINNIEARAEFIVNDVKYVTIAEQSKLTGEGVWTFEFGVYQGSYNWLNFNMTKQYNASVVFATVVKILKELIEHGDNVKELWFMPENERLMKFYERLIGKLKINGWAAKTIQYHGTNIMILTKG